MSGRVRHPKRRYRQEMIFLSHEWVAAMDTAAQTLVVGTAMTIDQVVTAVPGRGEVRYRLVFGPSGSRVEVECTGTPDISLTTDYATAVGLARGAVNAQEALARGRLRVGGNTNALVARSDALASIGDAFASLRDRTEYPEAEVGE